MVVLLLIIIRENLGIETKVQLPVTVNSDCFGETLFCMISSYLSLTKPPDANYFKGNIGLTKYPAKKGSRTH